MDIKAILNKASNNSETESYWSIIIEPGWVSASIWQIENEAVKIISRSQAVAWSEISKLSENCDVVLSACVQNLPENFKEPSKTVFGVSSSWVTDGDIKAEYLDQLKKVCQDLSLTPSGFVVLAEAIAHFIKVDEGSPLNGIVVGLTEDNFEISSFKSGKMVAVTDVLRSVSSFDDLVEGLTRINSEEVLPSRIILYDNKEADLENIRQELLSADWTKRTIKFLHTPKIDIVDFETKNTAVSLAGASEIAGISKIFGIENSNTQKEDNLTEEPAVQPEDDNIKPSVENFSASDLGFVVDQEPESRKINLPQMPKLPTISLTKFKFRPNGNKTFLVGSFSLFTFLVAGFLYWWFYPKAEVTLYVSPKTLEEKIDLELDEEIKTDSIEVVVSSEKTKSTSGTKTVGEKAKGSVKIQNGTSNAINLASGTVILSSGGLGFVVSESASVSAAISPSSPGTTTVDVTASSIGSEYNLAKDEIFKVANYPKADVDAVSTEDFSGGSSRQISAVSEDDLETLESDLSAELDQQAETEVLKKKDANQLVIESLTQIKTTKENFSNKVGDEATTLKLARETVYTYQVVKKEDLDKVAAGLLEGKIPEGYVVRSDQVNYKFSQSQEDDEKIRLDVTVNLLPKINTEDLAKKIAGRYPTRAEEFLSELASFNKVKFDIDPLLPGRLGTLPHLWKRITIEVTSEK